MDRTQKADEQLATLASHLTSRRAAILQAWRSSVDKDRELTAPSSLPRTQFNDHIPELLNAFEKRALARTGTGTAADLLSEFPMTAVAATLHDLWGKNAAGIYRNWLAQLANARHTNSFPPPQQVPSSVL